MNKRKTRNCLGIVSKNSQKVSIKSTPTDGGHAFMSGHQINVLLIEDDPVQAKLIQNLLADSPSPRFSVRVADRLSEGLQRISANGTDIVLLDLVLPDSEDLDTFARIRAKAPNLPVVILTGVDDVAVAARAVELGAQDYLLKAKVDQAALGRSIRYALERMRAG